MWAGFAYSGVWAWYMMKYFPSGLATLIPAAVGLVSGLMLALVFSFLRTSKPVTLFQSPEGLTRLLKSI
jgi:hypothetical protein